MKRLFLGSALLIIFSFLLAGCGELEFGVETRLTSGRPDPATVVVTATQQIADNTVLVTVTPSVTAESSDDNSTETVTPTRLTTASPTAEITATATVPATPSPTSAPPTATSRPFFPTATPAWPRVTSFTAVPPAVTLNSTVSASWSAVGESALLCLRFVSGWTDNCYDVALTGTRSLAIEGHFREDILLELEVKNEAGDVTISTIYLPLDCPDDIWFFDNPPPSCPSDDAVDSYAAVQQFENGWMLWIEETDTIYTFVEPSRSYSVFYSGFGDPDDPDANNSDYDPPDGLHVPVRGFGLVWRNYSYIRMALGWALAPEKGFDTTYQENADPTYRRLYLLNEDGRLVKLDQFFMTWNYQ